MKVMVTGVNGQLGHDVCKRLSALSIENKGVDITDFDLTSREQTVNAIQSYRPDCVVHCAAYTAVDKAESNKDICMSVNVEGTRNIALACKQCDCSMVYISTDYVFSGDGDQPFEVDSPLRPLSVYGETKLLGEMAVQEMLSKYFIVRTSWVYGLNGHNFVKTMLRLGEEKNEISVVSDQIGSPTYTIDLAYTLCKMILTEKFGIYHCTNEGFCSWYDFTCEIMKRAGLPAKIKPIESKDYPSPTKRPLNSRLSKKSLIEAGFAKLPTWQDALQRYLDELREASAKE